MISIFTTKKKSVKNNEIYITAEFRGLSTDTKGTTYKDKNNNEFIIDNGSLFVEIDTGYVYLYDIVNQDWEVQTGGGSGSNLQTKSVTVTQNGSSQITPDVGYDGLTKVNLTTNIQPINQTKSLTITENGTTSISPDLGYDGLSEVEITTNVSGGSSNNAFIDTTLLSSTSYVYNAGVTSLISSIDLIDTSQISSMRNFLGYSKITTLPMLDTLNVKSMREMLHDCLNLENVPILNTSKATNMQDMFSNCPNLTDTSLDNILQMCINSLETNKTLNRLGFNSTKYPASRIQALSHYQDFINAGWTIGYE